MASDDSEEDPKWLQEIFAHSKAAKKRDYLTLEEMLTITPGRETQVDFVHLGILLVLDKSKNGRFYRNELVEFHKLYSSVASAHGHLDFQAQFQAYCTLQLWDLVSGKDGEENFVQWFCNLLSESSHRAVVTVGDGEHFLRSDAVKTLHDLLSIQKVYGVEFQVFMDLMEQAAEDCEPKLMELARKHRLQDAVPLAIIKSFARDFMQGLKNMMTDLGFEPGMLLSPEEKKKLKDELVLEQAVKDAEAKAAAVAAAATSSTTGPSGTPAKDAAADSGSGSISSSPIRLTSTSSLEAVSVGRQARSYSPAPVGGLGSSDGSSPTGHPSPLALSLSSLKTAGAGGGGGGGGGRRRSPGGKERASNSSTPNSSTTSTPRSGRSSGRRSLNNSGKMALARGGGDSPKSSASPRTAANRRRNSLSNSAKLKLAKKKEGAGTAVAAAAKKGKKGTAAPAAGKKTAKDRLVASDGAKPKNRASYAGSEAPKSSLSRNSADHVTQQEAKAAAKTLFKKKTG